MFVQCNDQSAVYDNSKQKTALLSCSLGKSLSGFSEILYRFAEPLFKLDFDLWKCKEVNDMLLSEESTLRKNELYEILSSYLSRYLYQYCYNTACAFDI